MKPLFFCPQQDQLSLAIAARLTLEPAPLELRHFPDGESYMRVLCDVHERDVVLCQTLHKPDEHVLPLLLLADTLRDLGARRIGLIAPYLSYMRQDIRFKEGEGITSRYFARIVSPHFDWMATVDPHLHRYDSLDQIYSIPTQVIAAMPAVAQWIGEHIASPVLVGPDAESAQWVEAAASAIGCPYLILEKTRHGDRDVDIRIPHCMEYQHHTPVLVDDIISSGHTMMATARQLVHAGLQPPICIGVHAVFAPGAYEEMLQAPIAQVVTCDSIAHPSNGIPLASLIAEQIDYRFIRR